MPPLRAIFPPLLMLSVAACGPADSQALRQAWLVDQLVNDNAQWLSRDTAPLQTKYGRMADDPYDFMRGTAGVALADWSRPGSPRDETAFLQVPGASEVLLIGDPHPENLGSFLPAVDIPPTEGTPILTLEFNDLDASGFGPWTVDLRRSLLGLALILEDGGCMAECRAPLLTALIDGYVVGIADVAGGGMAGRTGLSVGLEDPVIEDLLRDVLAEGMDRERLLENTEPTADGRRFLKALAPDEEGRGLVPLSAEEQALLDLLLADLDLPAGAQVADTARRHGVGVASVPALRFVVLWQGGEPGVGDDGMVSLREVVDPPDFPGVRAGQPALFNSSADRLVQSSQWVWSRPDADPRLAGLEAGGRTFKVQSWSAYFQSLDHTRIARRIADGQYDPDTLGAFATRLGQVLAGAHGRGRTATGNADPATLIHQDLSRPADLAAEWVPMIEADLLRLHQDHTLFLDALHTLGPLLGAEWLR